jgi:hypothetical protein
MAAAAVAALAAGVVLPVVAAGSGGRVVVLIDADFHRRIAVVVGFALVVGFLEIAVLVWFWLVCPAGVGRPGKHPER